MFKLLKYSIKESYFEIVMLNGIMIALSIVLFAFIRLQLYFVIFLTAPLLFVYLAVFFILLKNIIISFHTDLFTQRGYLTLTTPISIDKLLLSKMIVNMLWILLTTLALLLSLFFLTSSFLNTDFVFASLFGTIWNAMITDPLYFTKTTIYSLFAILHFIMLLLFVLTFVNIGLFKNHKTIIGIISYIIISSILTNITDQINNPDAVFFLSIIFSTILYFFSRYFITNKLELE